MDEGALRRDLARQMAALNPKTGRAVGRLPFLSVLQHVKAFRQAHGRLPSSGSPDGGEAWLGRWLDAQREAARNAALPESHASFAEEALGPNWAGTQVADE